MAVVAPGLGRSSTKETTPSRWNKKEKRLAYSDVAHLGVDSVLFALVSTTRTIPTLLLYAAGCSLISLSVFLLLCFSIIIGSQDQAVVLSQRPTVFSQNASDRQTWPQIRVSIVQVSCSTRVSFLAIQVFGRHVLPITRRKRRCFSCE